MNMLMNINMKGSAIEGNFSLTGLDYHELMFDIFGTKHSQISNRVEHTIHFTISGSLDLYCAFKMAFICEVNA